MSSQVESKLPVNIDLIKMIYKRWSVVCDRLMEAPRGEFVFFLHNKKTPMWDFKSEILGDPAGYQVVIGQR